MIHTVPTTRFRRELNKWIRRVRAGDHIVITLRGRPITIVAADQESVPTLDIRLAEVRKLRGRLPLGIRVDRD